MASKITFNPSNYESRILSIEHLMEGGIENEVGLVIPNYQRDYTWEEDDLKRLYTDLLLGLSNREEEASGAFLGATVWCKRKRTYEPAFLIPSFDVVDGQQRITTCILLAMALFENIKKVHNKIKKEGKKASLFVFK